MGQVNNAWDAFWTQLDPTKPGNTGVRGVIAAAGDVAGAIVGDPSAGAQADAALAAIGAANSSAAATAWSGCSAGLKDSLGHTYVDHNVNSSLGLQGCPCVSAPGAVGGFPVNCWPGQRPDFVDGCGHTYSDHAYAAANGGLTGGVLLGVPCSAPIHMAFSGGLGSIIGKQASPAVAAQFAAAAPSSSPVVAGSVLLALGLALL